MSSVSTFVGDVRIGPVLHIDMRVCGICSEPKPASEFYGEMRVCKPCHNVRSRAYNKLHPPQPNRETICENGQCKKRFRYVYNATFGDARFCSKKCAMLVRHAGGKYGITREKFSNLYLRGLSLREIEKRFGISRPTGTYARYYVEKFRLHRFEPLVADKRLDSSADIVHLVALYKSGMSSLRIARSFGQNHAASYIRSLLIRAGVWEGRKRSYKAKACRESGCKRPPAVGTRCK